MASIKDPEVHSFLIEGTRTGKFAHLSAAGRSLVAPIWYIVEDEDLIFTGKGTVKGQYLALTAPGSSASVTGVPGELVVRVRPTKMLAYFNMTA